MTSTTLPPPPPSMVYANVLEYPKHRGRVTPETWLMALEQLQDTREARAAMRDVWAWEQSGCPLPEERESEQNVLDTRPRAKDTEIAFCANPECGLAFDRTNPKKAYCCGRCSSRVAYSIRKSKESKS